MCGERVMRSQLRGMICARRGLLFARVKEVVCGGQGKSEGVFFFKVIVRAGKLRGRLIENRTTREKYEEVSEIRPGTTA
jgi:hypothetical protein